MTTPGQRLSDFVQRPFARLFNGGQDSDKTSIARRPISRALGTLLLVGTLSLAACTQPPTPEEKACAAIVGNDQAKIEMCVKNIEKVQQEKLEKTIGDIGAGFFGAAVLLVAGIIYISIESAPKRRPEDDENPFLKPPADGNGKSSTKNDGDAPKPPQRKL